MTLWWPLEYADEVMPPGRANPNAWIKEYGMDGAVLFTSEPDYTSDGRKVRIGSVVTFLPWTFLSNVVLRIKRDGSFTVMSGAVDPQANCFVAQGDHDMQMDHAAEFARAFADLMDDDETDVLVAQSRWLDPVEHRLVMIAGAVTFTPTQRSQKP